MERDALHRRRALAGTATALTGVLGGCLDGLPGSGSSDDGSTGDDSADEVGDGIPPGGIADGEHRLYLANLDEATHRIDLEVYDRYAEEYVVDGTYELPGEKGAEFERIAGVEIRYGVTADVADGGSTSVTWVASSCEATGEASLQNAAIRVRPGGEELTLVEDSCDEGRAGTSVSFGPAGEFYDADA